MTEIRRRTAPGLAVAGIVVALIWMPGAGVPAHAQSTADPRAIVEQNLFHPSRTVPAPPKVQKSPVARPVPPPKPQPKFELSGVVMDGGNVRLALLAEPQWTQGKVQILGLGEMVGPYQVVSIASDHAMLAEAGEPSLRVPLFGSKRPSAPVRASGAVLRLGQGAAATQGVATPEQAGNLLQRRLRTQPQAEPQATDDGSGGGGAQQGNAPRGNSPLAPPPDTPTPQAAEMSPPVSETGQPVYRPASEGPSTPGPRPPAFDPEDFRRQIQQHLGGAK